MLRNLGSGEGEAQVTKAVDVNAIWINSVALSVPG